MNKEFNQDEIEEAINFHLSMFIDSINYQVFADSSDTAHRIELFLKWNDISESIGGPKYDLEEQLELLYPVHLEVIKSCIDQQDEETDSIY